MLNHEEGERGVLHIHQPLWLDRRPGARARGPRQPSRRPQQQGRLAPLRELSAAAEAAGRAEAQEAAAAMQEKLAAATQLLSAAREQQSCTAAELQAQVAAAAAAAAAHQVPRAFLITLSEDRWKASTVVLSHFCCCALEPHAALTR